MKLSSRFFVMVAAVVVAACSSNSPGSTKAPTSPPSVTQAPTTPSAAADLAAPFTIAYFPTQEQVSTAAVALGNMSKLTGMQTVAVDSGPSALPVFAQGTYAGLIEVGEPVPAIAFSKDIPIKIPWVGFQDPTILVTRNPISGPEGLRGLKIAAPGGSAGQVFLEQYLSTAGMTINDIQFVDLQAPELLSAFKTKAIDGGMIWPPFSANMVADGGTQIVNYPSNAMLIFSPTFIDQHRAIVQEFICGMAKTQNQFYSEPEVVYQSLAKSAGVSEEQAKADLPVDAVVKPENELSDTVLGQTDPSKPGFISAMATIAEARLKAGSITKAPTFNDLKAMIDPSFAQAVANGQCS